MTIALLDAKFLRHHGGHSHIIMPRQPAISREILQAALEGLEAQCGRIEGAAGVRLAGKAGGRVIPRQRAGSMKAANAIDPMPEALS
jgi:hypothetical protein